ncbi:putative N-formylglutamate amidohydrolase [Altererythrobacter atlanticus]|uniref:N-formylglutamate amidohydrolase n=1 Tax=Croceibacterium atlanticum TaxID=1267766 RepID=A0A0F7KQA5_9SPHN|nr:N-formylglutamate amidohydrolase [Croceibacterium atlanticum]AKH41729.1 N-formylglutamate amidohydrolase [Croceibacterium atlanticum]MBB5733193.1 putative N-formylglutamate amidohydrolase [Croceibacterium atlanticum]
MSELLFEQIGTPHKGGIVAVCDHASNHVPDGIELGVPAELMEKHIAWDIGAAGVTERLARRHDIPAHLACISRLVIDLHREEDSPGLIPEMSDGHLIPGNIGADRERRIRDYYIPYHQAMAEWLDAAEPGLILSIHSFTPALESDAQARPWEIGILYNQDDRAAQHALRLFAAQGVKVGDNEPYSGRLLNATMNRHAEAHGRPYLAIELRNDLIEDEAGQARWAAMIADIAGRVAQELE